MSPSLTIKYLAYADDLCIIAHSTEDINNFITIMIEFMDPRSKTVKEAINLKVVVD